MTLAERGPFFFPFFFLLLLVLFSRLFSSMTRGSGDDAGGEDAERKKEEASSRLLRACKQEGGDVEAARQAIGVGADVDVRDKYGWFPLRYAAHATYGNSLEIVQMLIDAGCDVDQGVDDGGTALHSAVAADGATDIMEALLRGGADPNTANQWAYTPCHHAKTVEVLDLLLGFGGDARKKNDKGMTPFQFRQRHYPEDVEDLRPIYEAWTPHRMLPKWTPSAFPSYAEQCEGFKQGIITLLLCLRRYRHMIPKEVGMEIVEYVAEMHRKEMWWPVVFDMEPYMRRVKFLWE